MFTISDIDKVLVKYVKKTIHNLKESAKEWGISDVSGFVEKGVWKELVQGFQGLEHKLNTVPCSRGDFAFTTLSFGNCDEGTEEEKRLQRLICEAILHVRKKGHNGVPVVFPKLVYLYSEQQHKTKEQQNLFDLCVECSSKTMYPDYLAIDTEGDVSRIYKKHGVVTSAMGK